ncbi:hypothetical protein P154DRAFT_575270 [Amniculicola lignicola CBS 123094]|uniref:Uncharacterized protein n=1 Tax=Amniculicola lignicola CBS 123094 TaxID=1392246 RepID=A0A6A5WH23_9PLEO|nr:hypothetical protein P154DRAFT_575270 [Amniculicola lignicola CBS 123094]
MQAAPGDAAAEWLQQTTWGGDAGRTVAGRAWAPAGANSAVFWKHPSALCMGRGGPWWAMEGAVLRVRLADAHLLPFWLCPGVRPVWGGRVLARDVGLQQRQGQCRGIEIAPARRVVAEGGTHDELIMCQARAALAGGFLRCGGRPQEATSANANNAREELAGHSSSGLRPPSPPPPQRPASPPPSVPMQAAERGQTRNCQWPRAQRLPPAGRWCYRDGHCAQRASKDCPPATRGIANKRCPARTQTRLAQRVKNGDTGCHCSHGRATRGPAPSCPAAPLIRPAY